MPVKRTTKTKSKSKSKLAPKPNPTELALAACRLLVRAYNNGDARGGDIEWDEVDSAFERARKALIAAGEDPDAYVDAIEVDEA